MTPTVSRRVAMNAREFVLAVGGKALDVDRHELQAGGAANCARNSAPVIFFVWFENA